MAIPVCVPLCRDEEIIMPDEHGGVVRENYLWKVKMCVPVLRCMSCGAAGWTSQESPEVCSALTPHMSTYSTLSNHCMNATLSGYGNIPGNIILPPVDRHSRAYGYMLIRRPISTQGSSSGQRPL